ncbi:MAG: FAD-binding oxidoreductase [Flavobacteriaceae bacterium]|nr:FAD-binding oxidoreductase [Flavobacteriaceae bacterium]
MESLITKLNDIVGSDYVISDLKHVSSYNQGTFPAKHFNSIIVKPASNEEIIKILATVNSYNDEQNSPKTKTAIYTVSSGKNWGYSAQEPSFDKAILLKLSRLTTIEEYDNKQGTVTVSAGVTQEQLYNFLQEQGGDFWMDATGSSPKCSIIGNTLERGFGHTPSGDHFAQVCAFEIILADGSTINTGFKQFTKNGITPVAANCYKWGIGPYVDGLFTQSNFGIVTKMTVWLMPKPEHFEAFFISIKDNDKLPILIDALQPLKLSGIIKSSAHIGNDHKAIQALSFYPWKKTNGQVPLPEALKDKLKKQFMVNTWSVSGAFYGTKAEVKVWKKILKKAMKGVADDIKFIDELTLSIAIKMKSLLSLFTNIDFNANIPLLEKVFRLKQGVPTNYFIPSSYWRKKTPPKLDDNIDPTKDNVGLLWLAPIAPIDGKHVKIMSDIIHNIQLKYGYEPGLSITLLTERALDCVISLVYDRDIEGEDAKALACHDELFEILTSKGYFPYRLSSHAHDAYQKINSSLAPQLKKIKQVLDEGNILSPKKYGI